MVVNGKIMEDKTPLPFAHAYLKTSLKGTISNGNGDFSLAYSIANEKTDTLIISCLGYRSIEIPLVNIAHDTCIFSLQRLPQELGEVVVLGEGLTPLEIIKKALKNRRKNLCSNQYYLEGLYRLNGYVGNKYGHLVEAATGVNVKDRWFDMEKDKIALYQTRSSINNLAKESYLKEKFGQLIRSLNGRTAINEFYYIFKIKGIEDLRWGCMGKDWDESFDFSIERVMVNSDSSKTYVINFYRKTFGTVKGSFYINSDNWKILRFSSELINHEENVPYPENILKTQEIRYQEINKKLFPLYIQTRTFGGAQRLYVNDDNGKKIKQYYNLVFMVNLVDPKMRKHRKDFKKHYLPRDEYFDPSQYPYSPEFWESYNMLQLNPQDKKMIEELSENMPLEEQFKQNGKQ